MLNQPRNNLRQEKLQHKVVVAALVLLLLVIPLAFCLKLLQAPTDHMLKIPPVRRLQPHVNPISYVVEINADDTSNRINGKVTVNLQIHKNDGQIDIHTAGQELSNIILKESYSNGDRFFDNEVVNKVHDLDQQILEIRNMTSNIKH